MEVLRMGRERLLCFVTRQISNMLPDDYDPRGDLDSNLDEALDRLRICINAVRLWRENQFDPLHSTQYCIFLYILANTIWRRTASTETPTRLFLLNKALNGIDLFYEIDMPEIFFIGHSVGIVLAKASYANYLVLYQNCTVGKNHGAAPVLEEGVVLYPNSAAIGRGVIRTGSVVSQGVSVINRSTQANKVAFQGANGSLIFKTYQRNILADIFRGG
jgi:serine O-acetyltransferase